MDSGSSTSFDETFYFVPIVPLSLFIAYPRTIFGFRLARLDFIMRNNSISGLWYCSADSEES